MNEDVRQIVDMLTAINNSIEMNVVMIFFWNLSLSVLFFLFFCEVFIYGYYYCYYYLVLLRAKKIDIFDVRSAFRTNSLPASGSSSANNSLGRSLRNDLLVAADSVTNAMSTLVRELNSGNFNLIIFIFYAFLVSESIQ